MCDRHSTNWHSLLFCIRTLSKSCIPVSHQSCCSATGHPPRPPAVFHDLQVVSYSYLPGMDVPDTLIASHVEQETLPCLSAGLIGCLRHLCGLLVQPVGFGPSNSVLCSRRLCPLSVVSKDSQLPLLFTGDVWETDACSWYLNSVDRCLMAGYIPA